jgi:uncharacterized damage-inducible protein DinB
VAAGIQGGLSRDALRELFDYTTFTWATYANLVCALPADALTRPIAGSGWPSLRDALFHIATPWDEWICARTGEPYDVPQQEQVSSWDQLAAVRAMLRSLLHRIIDEMPDEEFDMPPSDAPAGYGRSPREIVAHILLHERGHHGDVTTLLVAHGVQLPLSDYAVFLFFRER